MKICITAKNSGLDSQVDSVFGRCGYFLVIDTETEKFKSIANIAKEAERGAGVQAAQTVADAGTERVVCGNIGPNSQAALEKAGIGIISGASGTCREILEKFKSGELK